jgi:hypothetical protein
MTLSQETLFSLPMPPLRCSANLAGLLANSELVNKVYKQNAGSSQENVKHPQDLVQKLNNYVMQEFSELLLKTHRNSDLGDT